jgi:hypothetical protein
MLKNVMQLWSSKIIAFFIVTITMCSIVLAWALIRHSLNFLRFLQLSTLVDSNLQKLVAKYFDPFGAL